MRKVLLTIVILLPAIIGRSQVYVDGENINADSTVNLVEIVHSTHPNIFMVEYVDTGAKSSWRRKLTDANGKRMVFNSGVHIMNHMKQHGWKLVRRDMLFQAKHDASGNALVFLLFERAAF
ncbi:MAG TPA: hypothetical protein VD996_08490 [Chitinophagaceae bacterium]|nr:hypothetical protein [Chitinophagaceae bacterium]